MKTKTVWRIGQAYWLILGIIGVLMFFPGCTGFTIYGLGGQPISEVGFKVDGIGHPHNKQVTIFNATSLPITVTINGKDWPREIAPGEKLSFSLRGWAFGYSQSSVTIIASSRKNGRFVAKSKTFYSSSEYQRSESWIIRDKDLV
ncbi:MAG TPA: hypothetical protein PK367_01370 [Candidatus Paceibacterota bacterium]|nr:hypothetical protein [Candidatus Paceibacterota bacterium]